MRNNFIYILSWSILLLIATFPELFRSREFIETFNIHSQEFGVGKRVFLMPLLFAILLSGIDVVYLYLINKSKGCNLDLFWVLVMMLAFIGSLIVALFYSKVYLTALGFYIAWLSLTGMKFAVTEKCEFNHSELRIVTEK